MLKKIAACSITTAVVLISNNTIAHTTVKDQLTEGSSGYTALQIGHGCADASGVYHHVTAQSVLFPVGNAVATKTVNGVEESVGSLADHLVAGKFDGAVSLVTDRNLFTNYTYKLNAGGQVIGFNATGGDLYTNETGTAKSRGLVPFYVAAQTFVATSCAKSVKIKIAVADICSPVYPPADGSANTWIPSAAQLGASSYAMAGFNLDGVGSAATLTINRNQTTNPLPTSCNGGYDVNIWPAAEDIDNYLPRM